MRRNVIQLSFEKVHELLGLPKSVEIYAITQAGGDKMAHMVSVCITGDICPEVAPEAHPYLTTVEALSRREMEMAV